MAAGFSALAALTLAAAMLAAAAPGGRIIAGNHAAC
jgi:hypothetical protein